MSSQELEQEPLPDVELVERRLVIWYFLAALTYMGISLIGGLIMEALYSLDQVAYVRFASVYRNFREAKDFENFIIDELSAEER